MPPSVNPTSDSQSPKSPSLATFDGPNPFPDDFPDRAWAWECIQQSAREALERKKAREQESVQAAFRSTLDDTATSHWADDFDDRLNGGYEPWDDPNDRSRLDDDPPEDVQFFQSLTPVEQQIWRTIEYELEHGTPVPNDIWWNV